MLKYMNGINVKCTEWHQKVTGNKSTNKKTVFPNVARYAASVSERNCQ